MPTFAYSGRTRTGQTVTGEHIADTMDAAVAALRREQIMVTRIDPAKAAARAEAKAGSEAGRAQAGQGRAGEEPGDLHPPVLGHDRRRPAARAVSRHPRQAGAAQELLGGHPQGARGRRGRRGAGRQHEAAPEDVRRALLEHDCGGRGGRHPRHDSQAPRRLHREERQAQGRRQVGDDLPGRGHRHRGARRRRDSVEGHPDVRLALLGPGRRAAAADARRHRRERLRRGLGLAHRRSRSASPAT